VATHYVSLRRACPAPLGVACIIRRVLPQKQPDSSAWHHVQSTLVLLPAGTMFCGTAKHYSIGEVQSAYLAILAQAGRHGNVAGHAPPQRAARLSSPWVNRGCLSRMFS
jgi:hypothetical protein